MGDAVGGKLAGPPGSKWRGGMRGTSSCSARESWRVTSWIKEGQLRREHECSQQVWEAILLRLVWRGVVLRAPHCKEGADEVAWGEQRGRSTFLARRSWGIWARSAGRTKGFRIDWLLTTASSKGMDQAETGSSELCCSRTRNIGLELAY